MTWKKRAQFLWYSLNLNGPGNIWPTQYGVSCSLWFLSLTLKRQCSVHLITGTPALRPLSHHIKSLTPLKPQSQRGCMQPLRCRVPVEPACPSAIPAQVSAMRVTTWSQADLSSSRYLSYPNKWYVKIGPYQLVRVDCWFSGVLWAGG